MISRYISRIMPFIRLSQVHSINSEQFRIPSRSWLGASDEASPWMPAFDFSLYVDVETKSNESGSSFMGLTSTTTLDYKLDVKEDWRFSEYTPNTRRRP
jgi:hypothetical protein